MNVEPDPQTYSINGMLVNMFLECELVAKIREVDSVQNKKRQGENSVLKEPVPMLGQVAMAMGDSLVLKRTSFIHIRFSYCRIWMKMILTGAFEIYLNEQTIKLICYSISVFWGRVESLLVIFFFLEVTFTSSSCKMPLILHCIH